jgi:hypothetical protein
MSVITLLLLGEGISLLVVGLLSLSLFAFGFWFGLVWFGLSSFFGSRYSEGSFWAFLVRSGRSEFRLGEAISITARQEEQEEDHEEGTTPTPFFRP